MPAHGGDLSWASNTFGIANDAWLDLSTGVSPWSWPVGVIPAAIWRQLPQSDEPLRVAAATYYGCPLQQLLAIPGSQFAIARIPQLTPVSDVAIPTLGYKEHQRAWSGAGHRIHYYSNTNELKQLVEAKHVKHVVVINPNNPSAELCTVGFLQYIQRCLNDFWGGQGLLLIDEAFMDLTPEHSMITADMPSNTIILRSVGKYFGLAGIRLGFLVANSEWLPRFNVNSAPWSINHPALYIGQQALADPVWIIEQKKRIEQQSMHMYRILSAKFQRQIDNAGLFLTMSGSQEQCLEIFTHFAQRGVLLRYGEQSAQCESGNNHAWLRFGLPGEHIDVFKKVIQEYTV